MGKGLETGKTFLQGVLSKITDPGQRAAAEAVFANPVIVTEIGNGVEGQSEIDRQLQKLTTDTKALTDQKTQLDGRETSLTAWEGELKTWRTDAEDLVRLGAAAKKANWKPGDPLPDPAKGGDPTKLPPGVLTEEAFRAHMVDTEQAFLGFQAAQNEVQRRHFAIFGEFLDVMPLLKHPELKNVGLTGVYELIHKDALATKATEATKKREDEIRADERTKVLAANAQMPYPVVSGPGSGSPLDALSAKPLDGSVVERATAEYARLQAARPS